MAPVYSRMQSLKPGKLCGDGLLRYAAQLPVPRDRLVSLGEGVDAADLDRHAGP